MMSSSAIANPWLVFPKPNPQAVMRLFCFHYAGGNALIFRDWWKGLTPEIEVCAVQLPGRGLRLNEAPYTRLMPLAETLSHVVHACGDKPFAFFGHSMGSLLSFELARAMRRNYGLEPRHLFASGRQAPSLTNSEAQTYNLPESEFIEAVRRMSGTPAEVLENPELMQLILPQLRADFEVCDTYTYTPEPPLSCPITAFGGLQKCVKLEELEAWREHTSGAFTIRRFPGDHFFLNTSQPLLLRVLARELFDHIKSLTSKSRT